MLSGFIVQWLQASTLAQARTALLTKAETALDGISEDIRMSGNVDDYNRWYDYYAPGNSFGWQSNSGTLVLAKVATDKNNNIIYSDQAKYITVKHTVVYFRDGTNLYRRTIKSDWYNDSSWTTCPWFFASSSCPADKLVAAGVSSFKATYFDATETQVTPSDARSVQLAITLNQKAGTKTISASYSTRMVFRNE